MDTPPIPRNFKIRRAREDEDSFYGSIAQCINQLRPSINCDVQSLKQKCEQFAEEELHKEKSWLKDIALNDTEVECRDKIRDSTEDFCEHRGPKQIRNLISGRPEIQGRIISEIFKVKVHIIRKIFVEKVFAENTSVDALKFLNEVKSPQMTLSKTISDQKPTLKESEQPLEFTWVHVITGESGSKSVDNVDYDVDDMLHVIEEVHLHFKPILRTTSNNTNNNNNLEGDTPKDLSESSDENNSDRSTYKLIRVIRSKKPERIKLIRMEELLSNGADINFRDCNDNHNTVLHVAIRKRELKVIDFLVRRNANVHVKNSKNVNPLEYAEQLQIPFIIDTLKGNNEEILEETDESQMTTNERLIRLRRQEQKYCCDVDERELEELTSKPKFKKLSDDSGASGHRFEINLLTLFKLRGENLTNGFYLAGNLEEAGAFDDVVFKYWDQNNEAHIIFFQAKHRQEPRQRLISWETFQTEKDFALKKYFASYLEIKEKFVRHRTDVMFRGEFEQMNCSFVIYTNACLNEDRTRGLILLDKEATEEFPVGKRGYAMKIQSDVGMEYLMEYERKEYLGLVSKKLIQFVLSGNKADDLARDEIVKRYHIFWVRTVLDVGKDLIIEEIKKGKSKKEVKFRNAKFRQEFLRDVSAHPLTDLFRKEVLRELDKRKLSEKVIKVPEDFGNINNLNLIYPIDNLCRLFAELIDECEKSANTFVIENIPNKKLFKDISKLVGNVLIENEQTGFLTLNHKHLEGESKEVYRSLTDCLTHAGHNVQMDFDFQMQAFPILSLKHSSQNERNMKDFLNRLTIFTDQPSAKGLDDTIKSELKDFYRLTDEEVHHSYLRINHKMTTWWQETGSVEFLRKGDGFFSGIVRNGMHFRLRYPVMSFTGRVKELKSLHGSLQADKGTGMSPMVVICGLGGMGKSELARKYASEYGDRYDHNIIWIDAENSSTIRHSFRTLCQTVLNIPVQGTDGRQRKISAIIKDVYRFFGQRKSLFVFDNADSFTNDANKVKNEIEIFSSQSCPSNKFSPCIIVTSRSSHWPNKTKIQLDVFSDTETEDFVKFLLGIKDASQDGNIKSLADLLQNFPLALQQAVAFIRQEDVDSRIFNSTNSFRIGDYLKLYDNKSVEMLNFKFPEDSLDSYMTTTFKTWNITIEKIKGLNYGGVATKIMSVMSYFNPNDIPVEIFSGIVGDKEVITLKRAIVLLKQYSLITLHQGFVNIHRLVQSVVRINTRDKLKEKSVLRDALSLIGNHSNKKHMTQGVSIWNYTTNYTDLVIEFSAIPSGVIHALMEAVRFKEAKLFGETSFKLLKSLLGPSHESTLDTHHNYAEALTNHGKYEDAMICNKDLLDERSRKLGPNHEDCLNTQHNIAFILSRLSKYEEALCSYREVLEKKLQSLGPDHPSTVSTQHTIGMTLCAQGKLGALSYLEEVLEKESKILGLDHRNTLNTKHSIAHTLSNRGKYEEALHCYEEVLDLKIRTLGADHPDTLMTRHNIAHTFSKQGKYEEALMTFEELFAKKLKILGPDHPDTVSTQHMIGLTLTNQGKQEALGYLRDVLQKEERVLGPDHRSTLNTKQNIAFTLSDRGHHDEALLTYRQVFEKMAQTLGPDHVDTLRVQNNIADTLSNQGKYEEALKSFREVFEREKQTLGPDHPDILITQHNIALTLFKLGLYKEALCSYKEVFEKRSKFLGPDSPYTLTTQRAIAQTLSKQGEHECALSIYMEVFGKVAELWGYDHLNTLTIQYNIGETLTAQGKNDDALSWFKKVFEKRGQILGPDHPDTLLCQESINKILSKQGNL